MSKFIIRPALILQKFLAAARTTDTIPPPQTARKAPCPPDSHSHSKAFCKTDGLRFPESAGVSASRTPVMYCSAKLHATITSPRTETAIASRAKSAFSVMARTTMFGSQMPSKCVRTFTKIPIGKSRKERAVWLRISRSKKTKPEKTEFFGIHLHPSYSLSYFKLIF